MLFLPGPSVPSNRHSSPEAPMPHGKIYPDVSETLGNTPLIRLNRIASGLPGTIVVKHEGYNPFDSVKDRIGAAMINDAVEKGRLRPGMIIVEPTSGNTGIGIAYAAATRGFRCIFTMPETMTVERRNMLRALGAQAAGDRRGLRPRQPRHDDLRRGDPLHERRRDRHGAPPRPRGGHLR